MDVITLLSAFAAWNKPNAASAPGLFAANPRSSPLFRNFRASIKAKPYASIFLFFADIFGLKRGMRRSCFSLAVKHSLVPQWQTEVWAAYSDLQKTRQVLGQKLNK